MDRRRFTIKKANITVFLYTLSLARGLPINLNVEKDYDYYHTVQRYQEKTNQFQKVDLSSTAAASRNSKNSQWSYKDPSSWSSAYPTCKRSMQSPIRIDPKTAVSRNYDRLYFGNYDNTDTPFIIHNNGHTAFLSYPLYYPQGKLPYIQNGGLSDKFIFAQMHFHWGSDSSKGSEHQIRFKPIYPAELHIVHFNQKYGTFVEATHHPDGLAVLAVFLQVVDSDISNFRPIVDQMTKIRSEGEEATLGSLLSPISFLPSNTDRFYRYTGSLTTPGCDQIVIWTVFDRPILISEYQLSAFRSLTGEDGVLVNNFRPLQKLNDRTVTYRSDASCSLPNNWPFTVHLLNDASQYLKCILDF